MEMPVDPEAAAAVADRLTRAGVAADAALVVVHVSAGNPFRRWPAAHFVELVASLAAGDPRRRVIVTSGPSEHDAAGRVIADAQARARAAPRTQVLSCGEFSLAELRALLDRAALYIGGDSGPLHIAATTRVPIVGLYGPTLPVRSAPWREPRPASPSRWTPARCRAAPAISGCAQPGDFRCLTSITPAQVVGGGRTRARPLSGTRNPAPSKLWTG